MNKEIVLHFLNVSYNTSQEVLLNIEGQIIKGTYFDAENHDMTKRADSFETVVDRLNTQLNKSIKNEVFHLKDVSFQSSYIENTIPFLTICYKDVSFISIV